MFPIKTLLFERVEQVLQREENNLPFEHDDVRVYVDNLFLEGHLPPSDVIQTNGAPAMPCETPR